MKTVVPPETTGTADTRVMAQWEDNGRYYRILAMALNDGRLCVGAEYWDNHTGSGPDVGPPNGIQKAPWHWRGCDCKELVSTPDELRAAVIMWHDKIDHWPWNVAYRAMQQKAEKTARERKAEAMES